MRHSPEPWHLYFGNGDSEIEIADSNNVFVASLDSEVPEEYDHYNASRIVDCVNNCVGINPESVPLLLEALQRIADQDYSGQTQSDGAHLAAIARAAIAKANVDESESARTTKFFNDRHDARVAAGNQSLFTEGN